ncbi:TetR/AcrR family transcriptional regulator [Falsiroseomonas sp. HW251]|uniref:TetR/AcrR family transcriptional regulator n=1 Tax=Falsiroseomonas sp. HW251 TaxID=3390998 RepID=UPI003D316E32
MPRPSRTRRKEDRPAELLEAALDTFRAKGFAATRMDDIAARAGVSKGTIYLYYPSKEAIFEALVRDRLLPNLDRVEAAAAASPLPAGATLRLIAGMASQVMADARLVGVPKMVLAEAGNFPELARFYREAVVARALALIAGVIRRGIAAGEFRDTDPEIAARLFVFPVLVTALWQATFAPVEDHPVPPAKVVEQHLETWLRGMARDGAR